MFYDATLVAAGTLENPTQARTVTDLATLVWALEGCKVVAEWPQDYAQGRDAHEDLSTLREMVEGVETATGVKARRILPRAWKGNVPKIVCAQRVVAALGLHEALALLDRGEDTYDAVGVGLFHLGRVKRGVIPCEK